MYVKLSLEPLTTATGVFGPSRLTGRCPPQGATSARWTMPSARSTARSRHSALVAWPTRSSSSPATMAHHPPAQDRQGLITRPMPRGGLARASWAARTVRCRLSSQRVCCCSVRFPDPFACCWSQAVLSGSRATIRTVSATSSLRPPAASLTTRIATGGWKSQIWDGGLHVAGFVHSPLLPKSAQGTQHHGLFHVRSAFARPYRVFALTWRRLSCR